MDLETAQTVFGDKFDEALFDELKDQTTGKVSADRVAQHIATTAVAAAETTVITTTTVVAALKETVLAATKRNADNAFARDALLKALVAAQQQKGEGPAVIASVIAASTFMLGSNEAVPDAMSEEEAAAFLQRAVEAESKDGEQTLPTPRLPAIFDPEATALDPDQEYQSIASIEKLVQGGAIVLLNAKWLMHGSSRRARSSRPRPSSGGPSTRACWWWSSATAGRPRRTRTRTAPSSKRCASCCGTWRWRMIGVRRAA